MAQMKINDIQVIVAPGRNLLTVKVINDQTLGGVGDIDKTVSVTA